MLLEKLGLRLERARDGLLLVDVALSSVDDWDVAESERDDSASEDVDDVGSSVPGVGIVRRACELETR